MQWCTGTRATSPFKGLDQAEDDLHNLQPGQDELPVLPLEEELGDIQLVDPLLEPGQAMEGANLHPEVVDIQEQPAKSEPRKHLECLEKAEVLALGTVDAQAQLPDSPGQAGLLRRQPGTR